MAQDTTPTTISGLANLEVRPDDFVVSIEESGIKLTSAQRKRINNARSLNEAIAYAQTSGVNVEAVNDWEDYKDAAAGEGTSAKADAETIRNPDPVTTEVERQAAEGALIPVDPALVSLGYDASELGNQFAAGEMGVLEDAEVDTDPRNVLSKYGASAGAYIEAGLWEDDYSPWGPDTTYYAAKMRSDIGGDYADAFRGRFYMRYEDRVEKFGWDSVEQLKQQEAYWEEQYAPPSYKSGDAVRIWAGLGAADRNRLEDKLVRAGQLEEGEFLPGAMGHAQLAAMDKVMNYANGIGMGYELALDTEGDQYQNYLQNRGHSGASRPSFKVPASLREIPDYESISEEARQTFRQRLGRQAEDWEVELMADQLQGQYKSANQQRITAARAAFYGGGDMEVEVSNPQLRLDSFISEKYGAELSRQDRMEDGRATRQAMIGAITQGKSMVDSI